MIRMKQTKRGPLFVTTTFADDPTTPGPNPYVGPNADYYRTYHDPKRKAVLEAEKSARVARTDVPVVESVNAHEVDP